MVLIDSKIMKVDQKIHIKILLFTILDRKHQPFYLIFDKINKYIEDNNRSQYLTTILTMELYYKQE